MSKILIVDDEPVYRRQLEIALLSKGNEIRTASSGREAIDVGVRYRPDVLVTDWMLQDHIHGLHVARVLHAIAPGIGTILITGFPSDDLRAGADKTSVLEFIEKPFSLERIEGAIEKASSYWEQVGEFPKLAVIEVDVNGSILYANDRAKEFFEQTWAGSDATNLAEFFSPEAMPDLDAAIHRWVVASPLADQSISWRLRSQAQSEGESRLVVLLHRDDPHYVNLTLIEMLLGFKDPEVTRWPMDGRVLIIDPEAVNRHWFVSSLERVGAGCYAVESIPEGLKLLQSDEGLMYVILGIDMPDTDLGPSVEEIRLARPDVVIVGTSDDDYRNEFAAVGVKHFLQQPWQSSDLINELTGRIGNCAECGLPIPLRRPREGEVGNSWICTGCGTRYFAVFDDYLPIDMLENVRPGG